MTFTEVKEQVSEDSDSREKLTLEQFLSLPEGDVSYELVDGEVVPKMSPKFFHSVLTTAFWIELSAWCTDKGRVVIEWSIPLQRHYKDWCPVPDLLYIFYSRLPQSWIENAPCPARPELVIEIMSEGQTFKYFVAKVGDYLNAGVDRVWVIDPDNRTLTVFYPDRPPENYRGDRLLTDELFPNLAVTAEQFFVKAGI